MAALGVVGPQDGDVPREFPVVLQRVHDALQIGLADLPRLEVAPAPDVLLEAVLPDVPAHLLRHRGQASGDAVHDRGRVLPRQPVGQVAEVVADLEVVGPAGHFRDDDPRLGQRRERYGREAVAPLQPLDAERLLERVHATAPHRPLALIAPSSVSDAHPPSISAPP